MIVCNDYKSIKIVNKNMYISLYFRDLDALLHVVKSSLGSGILAISDGFKNAGTVVGIIGTVFIGMLCTHCTYVMVRFLL